MCCTSVNQLQSRIAVYAKPIHFGDKLNFFIKIERKIVTFHIYKYSIQHDPFKVFQQGIFLQNMQIEVREFKVDKDTSENTIKN